MDPFSLLLLLAYPLGIALVLGCGKKPGEKPKPWVNPRHRDVTTWIFHNSDL